MGVTVGLVSAVAGVYNAYETRKDAKAARAEAQNARVKAETEATQRATAQTVMARRALKQNSLFTGGGDSGAGRSTLGV